MTITDEVLSDRKKRENLVHVEQVRVQSVMFVP